jgi:hypothetical protein
MNAIVRTFKAVLGLFFDDGSLALSIVALLVWMALLAQLQLVASSVLMVLLVGGTLMLLLENVVRTARQARG